MAKIWLDMFSRECRVMEVVPWRTLCRLNHTTSSAVPRRLSGNTVFVRSSQFSMVSAEETRFDVVLADATADYMLEGWIFADDAYQLLTSLLFPLWLANEHYNSDSLVRRKWDYLTRQWPRIAQMGSLRVSISYRSRDPLWRYPFEEF